MKLVVTRVLARARTREAEEINAVEPLEGR